MNIFYFLLPASVKRKKLFQECFQDAFLGDLIHAVRDFGLDVHFSVLAGAGAYQPFALSTEKLDSAYKQQLFTNGFVRACENGNMKAQILLSSWHGHGHSVHGFIHEFMHLYQDMYGLFFVPLKEQGKMPVMLDAYSNIISILFCEAWAQVQAIRFSYKMKCNNGRDAAWRAALSHPDFGYLAHSYQRDLDKGTDEKVAAAGCFVQWYEGRHRIFYERHALDVFNINYKRLSADVEGLEHKNIGVHLRKIEYCDLTNRLPDNQMTDIFDHIDFDQSLFSAVVSDSVRADLSALGVVGGNHGGCESNDVSDIKCGAPIYIWNRLRVQEIDQHDVPVELFEMARNVSAS